MDRAVRCPLCGEPNGCGAAAGKGVCGCWSALVSAEAIARVPEDMRGTVCICERCAQAVDSVSRNIPVPFGFHGGPDEIKTAR